MFNFGIEVYSGKVHIRQEGSRIIDGLDFSKDPILLYLELRWGRQNILINGQPISNEQYKFILDYENNQKNCC